MTPRGSCAAREFIWPNERNYVAVAHSFWINRLAVAALPARQPMSMTNTRTWRWWRGGVRGTMCVCYIMPRMRCSTESHGPPGDPKSCLSKVLDYAEHAD
jgi:hypothetical protein